MTDIDVDIDGPFFRDVQRNAAVGALIREVTDDVLAQAYAEVMTNLNASIQNPTPYYETQITTSARVGGGANQAVSSRRVHDRGVVYGPWLETGAGRNTSFRGYRSFARARAAVQARVPTLVQAALARAVQRLGGGA